MPVLTRQVEIKLVTEIERETQIRDLAAFHRFIKFGSLTSSQIVNFSKLADDAQVASHTIREYYEILSDTLIGFMLPAFTKTSRRKPTQKSKFYFFDIGVKHAAMNLESLDRHSDLYGQAFEHFIISECRAYLSYTKSRKQMYYWRSTHQDEVDLILGEGDVAIKIKASERTSDRDHKGLIHFKEEGYATKLLLVSQDPLSQTYDNGVEHLHYRDFFSSLWNGQII